MMVTQSVCGWRYTKYALTRSKYLSIYALGIESMKKCISMGHRTWTCKFTE